MSMADSRDSGGDSHLDLDFVHEVQGFPNLVFFVTIRGKIGYLECLWGDLFRI